MSTTDAELFGDSFADDDVSEARWETWTGRYNRYMGLKRGRGKTVETREFPPLPGMRKWDSAAFGMRVTTLAETLTDKYQLEQWKLRQTVLGIRENPGLLDLLGKKFNAASDQAKALLNAVVSQAMDLVGSNEGSELGTMYHDIAEKADQGSSLSLDHTQTKWLKGYLSCLKEHQIEILPQYMERVVCCPDLGVTGRLDRAAMDEGVLRILDLKTQKWRPGDYDGIKMGVQFACYAQAKYMLDEESWTWEDMPQVDQKKGVVIWAPAVEPGTAQRGEVDLELGWTLAKASLKTREWRKNKNIVVF
jgi:hypothetical protein